MLSSTGASPITTSTQSNAEVSQSLKAPTHTCPIPKLSQVTTIVSPVAFATNCPPITFQAKPS